MAAKPNYGFEKRQRELEKKRKKAEKAEKRTAPPSPQEQQPEAGLEQQQKEAAAKAIATQHDGEFPRSYEAARSLFLEVAVADGRRASFPLPGLSVAAFYRQLLDTLSSLGLPATVERPVPFDLADRTPFAEDEQHASYDRAWVTRYWLGMGQVAQVLEEFAGRSYAKTSPVHHFWHTFDIAHTRFSDRHVDQSATADPVTREAYSREVISFGFWFGDDRLAEPAFYAYVAPEPPGLADQPLEPQAAWWEPRDGSHLAVLGYDDARASADPRASVLDFYESAYQAGARLAGWDVERLTCPGGITERHPAHRRSGEGKRIASGSSADS